PFDIISASITPSGPTTICQGNSVTLTASAASTYLWSTGATSQAINVSSSGNYTVTVSSTSGCSAISSAISVTVNPSPSTPTITPSGPTAFCQGNSVTLTASAASTYLWSNNATAQAIIVSSTGNYIVTITSANGCSASSSATSVTVNPLPPVPTITPSGTTTFCQGNSVTLTASSASTYLWSNNSTTQAITVSNSGNYGVTITNANGCSAISTATSVTANPSPPPPAITPSGPTTFCQGNSVTLTASAASTYLWSNGATTQAITVSSSGNYGVTITNANGCSASSNATSVTVNPLPPVPTITPSGATAFCQGNSVTLTASAASTYLWSNNLTTQGITVSISGNYIVTVTNANGCSASSSATSVTVNPLPPVPTITPNGATTFCQGNSVTLTASAASTYLWSNSATTQAITVSNAGNYGVTITNANGCSAISTATSVTVYPSPLAPIITLIGTTLASSNPAGNQWYLNGNIIPNATAQTYPLTQNGDYTVLVTDTHGCSASSTVFHYVHTGTETITESNTVLIVPNPNDGKFRVEMQNRSLQMEDLDIEVYNLLGEKVFMTHVQQLNPIIDISLQPGGTYFVKISGAKWKRVVPIIKI
ncbi:MAG: T9SS type A sorting domain-containing protein, partial [Phycisphaerae bacterium]|nr:T9SS type A sorting domain-containing protein [Saprospiraceae bacterium]